MSKSSIPHMEHIVTVFARTDKIISRIIRWVTMSEWSHCGMLYNGYVYESLGGVGVVKTPVEVFKQRYKGDIKYCLTPCKNANEALILAEHKVATGVKYDHQGAIGVMFRRNMNMDNRDHCSEFLADLIGFIKKDKLWRITPEFLETISEDIT